MNKSITRTEADALITNILREINTLKASTLDIREQDRKAVEERGSALAKSVEDKSGALAKSMDEKFTSVGKEIQNLRESRSESEGRDRGLMLAWGVIITIVSIGISLIGFLR